MKYGVLKYLSYTVLVFGFLYMSWHLGRAFERDGGGEAPAAAAYAEPGLSAGCARPGALELTRK